MSDGFAGRVGSGHDFVGNSGGSGQHFGFFLVFY